MTEAAPRSWRGLAGVLAAQGLAWTGTRLSAIALPWFVLTSTGSATQTGIVVFVEMTPYVIVQLLSGPLIDHMGPRRISIAGDLISTGAVAMIPLLYAIGALEMWSLLPLVAVVGASRGPSDAAKGVFIPAMTEAAGVPLERGTGLAGTVERLASTVGPGVAGILVAWVGGAYALTVTAVVFGLGAVVIAWATPRDEPSPELDSTAGYLARLRGGAEFVRGERLLRSIVAMVAITNLLDAAWISVLLPVWARATGHGPAVIGLVVAVMSAASIMSSVLAAAFAHRMPRRPTYLIGFLLGGAPRFVVLALGAPIWLIVAVYVVSGFSMGFINPIIGAIQFERAPREMYGRVRTLVVAVAWSGIPFGGLVGGSLVALLGLSPALLVAGGAYLITTTLPAFQKEWAEVDLRRRLEATRHAERAARTPTSGG
jgi:MFS family permease